MTEELASALTTVATPYIGPRPFRAEEHEYFFGREREARDLLSLVIAERLTLFYAQSGAGKSSLINTRLLPGLRKAGFVPLPVSRVSGTLPTAISEVRNIYIFNLLLSLLAEQQNLDPLANMSLIDCLANLASDDGEHFYLSAAAAPAPVSGSTSLPAPPTALPTDNNDDDAALEYTTPAHVLIIDQFEELFTTHADRWPERADFFRQLQEAQERDPLLWVVLVMREDFVAELDPYTNLLTDKLRIRYYMQRMGLTAAQQAIQQPARKHGRPFTDDALTDLVDNLSRIRVMGQRDPLPGQYVEPVQLQVVCLQLWANLQSRPPGSITIDDLQEAGDVDRALADYYEESLRQVQERLPGLVSEIVLRDWFSKRLITENGTRGLVNQGATATGGLPNEVVQLLDTERYLVRRESRAGGVWCELTHDRFVQPILDANQAWAERNRNPLTVVTRIWLENNHDPQRLLRGKQLGDAQAYALTHSNWIGEDEKEFLEASVRHEREEKTRQKRAIAITTLVVMLLAGLGYWGWRSAAEARNQRTSALAAQNYAETQYTRARASELAAQSQSVLDSFPQRSLLLAVEAFSATQQSGVHVSAAEEALRQALGVLNIPPLGSHQGRINAMVSSPDNHWLVTASDDNTARLWNLQAPNPAANPIILRGHTGAINAVAISSDNHWLVTASDDTTARLWNLQAPDPTANPIILRGHKYGITTIAISSDNFWLVTTSGQEGAEQNDTIARLWNLQAPDPAANAIVLSGHGRAIIAVDISPDSHWLVTASEDATARLWNLRSANPDANPIILRGHHSPVSEIAISSDSRWLVTASGYSLSIFEGNLEPDSTVRLWDLKASDPADIPIVLHGQHTQVSQIAISPDNRWLVIVSNKTYLWDLQTSDIATDPIILDGDESRVSAVAISPDSHWLVTTGRYGSANQLDTTARLWNLWTPDPTVNSVVLRGHKEPITTFAVSPDSHWLATGSEDATTHLWDLRATDPATNAIVLYGHEYAVSIVQFTANSRWLATAGNSIGTGVYS